ncbi:hypothetical protein [Sphingosinicella sp. BN140058]|uniref:hypothetical protein n=1 Tax=Sphingosinicella sp. BN140058 TaxID=1892855 RepID=UPI0010125D4B|nr:hypothetical protein [Sphingosinicella sp. BN140058]QAY80147.1 hypothetical protein ETR14_26250 [Sphingosinicella sp. BN140058]
MVAWFVIAIATLGLLGYIAVSSAQTISVTTDAAGRVETVRRLDSVVNAILVRAAAADGTGAIFLPAGAANPAGQGYGLPADLAPTAVTPFGQRFVYCPFGSATGTGAAVTISNANGTSYGIATTTLSGRAYVTGGRPGYAGLAAMPNLLGYVLAPRTKLSATPSCNEVVYDPGSRRFQAPDAIVRPIVRDGGVDEARTVNSRKLVFFVAPGASGSGASASDPADFQTALDYYQSRRPLAMTIQAAAGNYDFNPGSVTTDGFADRSDLTIRGAGPTLSVFRSTAQGWMNISGRLTLDGVGFDQYALIRSYNGEVVARNITAGSIRGDHALITLFGTNVFNSGATYGLTLFNGGSIEAQGADITIGTTLGIMIAQNGRLTLSGSILRAAGPVLLYDGAETNLKNNTINYTAAVNPGLFVQKSKATLSGNVISFAGSAPVGISLMNGSIFEMSNGSINGAVVNPVVDSGALSVSGSGTQMRSSGACWAGILFGDSVGASSAVRADDALPAVSTPATGPEVQAYAAAQANNARRGARRSTNTSSWTCLN